MVTKLAHDGLQVSAHPGCAQGQGQGQGQRLRDTGTFVLARKSLLLPDKWRIATKLAHDGRMYMKQVTVLLQFQHATRKGNGFLYLAALEKLCVYFFAYNRLDFAQNIPEYIARMHELKNTDPDIWQEFVNGDFSVNTSNNVPFKRVGVDQAMEHLSKCTKGQGGICGITSHPKILLKLCLTGPELARLKLNA